MVTIEQIAAVLAECQSLPRVPARHPISDWRYSPGWYPPAEAEWPRPALQQPTVDQLGKDLLRIAESQGIQLGDFFNTPSGELLSLAIKAATPAFYQADVALIIESLQLAAKLQQRGQRVEAGLAFGAAVLGGYLIVESLRNAA